MGSTVCDIKLETLLEYYSTRFARDDHSGCDTIQEAEATVSQRYEEIKDNMELNYVITKSMILAHLSKLRTGCAAGIDGITAEHLKWAKDSRILPTICCMLTLCIRFGIVPDSFTKGLLIPLLKKPNIDPTIPKHYRPIVISSTFSKLLEILILDACGEHEFHDLQFGFVESRGTAMAAALTHDVIDYCTSNNSPVYVCALDAEGAFDGIPHAIIFLKAMDAIPVMHWRILVYWYSRLVVFVKWGDHMSEALSVCKGTRQGGLSSPFIFNLLYQGLVEKLSQKQCGISINGVSYNLCCYADDLLLCSLSITGLQTLIDEANYYIKQHGLRFNPAKTKCITFGKSSFHDRLWNLEGTLLEESDHVSHLGVILSDNPRRHTDSRIKAAKRAFYALQGAGLCTNGSSPDTIAHIFSTAVRPVLLYGLESVHQSKQAKKDAEILQGKLLKAALGLKTYSRNSPLLQALKIPSVGQSIELQELTLFRSMFLSRSRSQRFYKFLLTQRFKGCKLSKRNILHRILNSCDKYDIAFYDYICTKSYLKGIKRDLKKYTEDGIADSVSYILQTYASQNDRSLLNALLSPF